LTSFEAVSVVDRQPGRVCVLRADSPDGHLPSRTRRSPPDGRLRHDGNLVGPNDILAQVDQIVANATVALTTARANPDDVVRSVIYVVSDDPRVLSSVWDRLTGSGIGPAFTTASTLLGVAALGYRGQLVEVELTAAIPDSTD